MEVQTRNREGALEYFTTLTDAYEHSQKYPEVWKISFQLPTGERVRLVKVDHDWVWQDIIREVKSALEEAPKPTEPKQPVGVFKYLDRYFIDGRGLVLAGEMLEGTVDPGMYVQVSFRLNTTVIRKAVRIEGVERVTHSKKVGLLLQRISLPISGGQTLADVSLTIEDTFPIIANLT